MGDMAEEEVSVSRAAELEENISLVQPENTEQEDKDLALLIKRAVSQFETQGKPIVPSALAEHLGIPDKLREVVSQLRALDYATTQEIDPGSHMNIWKADSSKGPKKRTPVMSEEAVA